MTEKRSVKFRAAGARKGFSCLIALLILTLSALPVSASGTGTHYRGTTGVTAQDYIESFEFDIRFSPEWFVLGDNTVYFSELAQFAAVAANASYGTGSGTSEAKQGRSRISGEGTDFYEALGIRDAEVIEAGEGESIDENDCAQLLIGHLPYETGHEKYEILFVSVRGSITAADWLSNIDVGADTDSYTLLTGEHPEWTDREMHKGFCVTANRAKAVIDEYILAHVDPEAKKTIFLTGHSRGGAVANILGVYYEAREDICSFTYTFASPATTTASEEDAACASIFNIINDDDIVPLLPAENWGGFRRYGTDLTGEGNRYTSQYSRVTGKTYVPAEGYFVTEPLSQLLDTREALYEFDEDGSYVLWYQYTDKDKAEKEYAELLSSMEEAGVEGYFSASVDETEEDGETVFNIGYTYRPAYVIQLIAQVLSLEGVRDILDLDFFPLADSYEEAASEFILPAMDGSFLKSHLLPVYYCLTTQKIDRHPGHFITGAELILIFFREHPVITVVTAAACLCGLAFLILAWRFLKKRRAKKGEKHDRAEIHEG